jgi:hypothetical protein
MQKQRKLKKQTTGMFAGPRGAIGQYINTNMGETSGGDGIDTSGNNPKNSSRNYAAEVGGTTYGGQGNGWFWDQYPGVTGGLTRYDPRALQPGSNMSAVQYGAKSVAKEAGRADGKPTGASVGGTAGY